MKQNNLYRLMRTADEDLIDIWTYVAERNISAADCLIDELYDVFKLLGREPLLGEIFDPDRPFLRRFTHDNYVIYYNTATDPLGIVRVLHGARNVQKLL